MKPEWMSMALVGRIARPHGLRGHVVVSPETDFVAERFAPGAVLWTRLNDDVAPLRVAGARPHAQRLVVSFEGFDRIEDAERLAGQELRIAEAALRPLEPGRYYPHQLEGCQVETTRGERVGTVRRVEGGGGNSRLVIDGERGEVQVPLADDICRVIDVTGRRIVIDPPEGLVELNEREGRR